MAITKDARPRKVSMNARVQEYKILIFPWLAQAFNAMLKQLWILYHRMWYFHIIP